MTAHPVRMTLSAYDAEHLNAILHDYWHNDHQRFGGCYECRRTTDGSNG